MRCLCRYLLIFLVGNLIIWSKIGTYTFYVLFSLAYYIWRHMVEETSTYCLFITIHFQCANIILTHQPLLVGIIGISRQMGQAFFVLNPVCHLSLAKVVNLIFEDHFRKVNKCPDSPDATIYLINLHKTHIKQEASQIYNTIKSSFRCVIPLARFLHKIIILFRQSY